MLGKIRIVPDMKNRCRIECEDVEFAEMIRQSFMYVNRYIGAGQNTYESTECPITLNYTFRIGLTFDIVKRAKELGLDVSISKELKDILKPSVTPISENIVQPANTKFKFFDFQEAAIESLLKHGRGVWVSPTGSGKSIMSYGIIRNIKEYSERTLVVVPKTSLVVQFYNDYKEYDPDIKVSMFCSQKKHRKCDKTANIIVSNIQWLNLHANELPRDIKAIIVDECHHTSANTLLKLVNSYSTPYKLGMTATLPEDLNSYYKVIGTLHHVIYKESIVKLQQDNHLAQIDIYPVELKHKYNDKKLFPTDDAGGFCDEFGGKISTTTMYNREMQYLEHHNEANNAILRFMEKVKGNSIILAEHVEHVDYLYDNLNVENKFKIYGNTDIELRDEVRHIVDSNPDKKYYIVAGVAAFAEGTNIKNIQNLAFTCHGKAKTKVLQSIGRSLRKIDRDQSVVEQARVFDFFHNFTFSLRHYKQRCKLYLEYYNKKVSIFNTIKIETKIENFTYGDLNNL